MMMISSRRQQRRPYWLFSLLFWRCCLIGCAAAPLPITAQAAFVSSSSSSSSSSSPHGAPAGLTRPTTRRRSTKAAAFLSLQKSNTTDRTTTSSSSSVPSVYNSVQRVYETYQWKYQNQTYNINYRVEGPLNGQPILLIHGFGANVNHFRYNIPVLSSSSSSSSLSSSGGGKYRVYAIDLLGFGASDKPNNVVYCMELFFQLCIDFIQEMNTQNQQKSNNNNNNNNQTCCWFVAGNSIGGLTALSVAKALPQIIQGIILFACADGMSFFRYKDIPIYLWPIVWFFQKVILSPIIGGSFFNNFKTRDNVERVLRTQGVYVNQTNVNNELLEILLAPGDDIGAQDVFLKVMAGEPGPKPDSILPYVKCPILALWGEYDPWTTINGPAGAPFRELAGSYTSSDSDVSTSTSSSRSVELDIIPNTGHCVMDEVPDQVHDRMIPWMDKIRQCYDPTRNNNIINK